MKRIESATRATAFVLIASGIGLLSVALIRGDRVNVSGFVPSVVVAFLLLGLAVLAFSAAGHVHDGRYGRLAVVAAVSLWLVGSDLSLLWLPRGSLTDIPLGTIIGLLIVGGVFLTLILVGLVVVLMPVMTVLAWLADRVPALRRQHVGDEIRRQSRPRL